MMDLPVKGQLPSRVKNPLNQLPADVARAVEQAIIGRIEEIEGRVPNNLEMEHHGKSLHFEERGSQLWLWRGEPIVKLEVGDAGWRVTQSSNTTQSGNSPQ